MTIDTGPKCPKCGATVYALVEHHCKIDPDSIDAPIVVAVCERLPAAGWLPPADAARLRALLRELAGNSTSAERFEEGSRKGWRCRYCTVSTTEPWHTWAHIEHTGDCPVRRAREAVGDEG